MNYNKTVPIILFALLLSSLFQFNANAYSEQTQSCIDRVNGHIIKSFTNTNDLLTDKNIQIDITKFCLSTTPSLVSTVSDYSEFTKLGQIEWDMLEEFVGVSIVRENVLNNLMSDSSKSVLLSIKDLISQYNSDALNYKNTYISALSKDDYYSNSTSAVYRISKLIESEYSEFLAFTSAISENLNNNYTCDSKICTLTSSLKSTTQQTMQTQISYPTQMVSNNLFSDVQTENVFYEAIKFVKNNKIVDGYSDGSYKPDSKINRAEFTKILILSAFKSEITTPIESPFKDTPIGDWFVPFVSLAKVKGIIAGYPDGTFKPSQNISIAEALKISLSTYFKDIPLADGEWYQKYINFAKNKGIYLSSWYYPSQEITRGEMAQLIFNIENNK